MPQRARIEQDDPVEVMDTARDRFLGIAKLPDQTQPPEELPPLYDDDDEAPDPGRAYARKRKEGEPKLANTRLRKI